MFSHVCHLGLAKELNLSVWLPSSQNKLVRVAAENGCPLCQALLARSTSDRRRAQLHVASMNQITANQLMQYRALPDIALPNPRRSLFEAVKQIPNTRSVLAWRPTGWSHVPWNQKQAGTKSARLKTPGVRLEVSNNQVSIYGTSACVCYYSKTAHSDLSYASSTY
ncbi:unnamed protein product [Echinostoma caproni]|uniref:DRMBL domain-containing protein n=1 Tax=Echinostoma caproni TaxID=27848 RepID=A0A183AM42_9TREM|nr:unnamed protein product [Echinostoma caproni]